MTRQKLVGFSLGAMELRCFFSFSVRVAGLNKFPEIFVFSFLNKLLLSL